MESTVVSIQDNKFGIMHYLHKLFDPPVLFAEEELSDQMAGLMLFFLLCGNTDSRSQTYLFCMWKPELSGLIQKTSRSCLGPPAVDSPDTSCAWLL